MTAPLEGLSAAFRLLTVLPAGAATDTDETGSWAFPVVGLAVGLVAVPFLLLPLPPVSRAVLAVTAWIAVTGGLHEDGWADCADAALSPVSPERRRAILKDPRIGAHGATALVLLVLLRLGALVAAPVAAALVAPVVARWWMVVVVRLFPASSPEGLGAWFRREASPGAATLVGAGILAGIMAGGLLGSASVAAAVVGGGACGWGAGHFLSGRLGGIGGDAVGAAGVAAELGALWSVALLVGSGP